MRSRKRVIDIGIRRCRQRGSKIAIIGFFTGVKARVFQNANATFVKRRQSLSRRRADAVLGKSHIFAKQRTQSRCDRRKAHLSDALAFGASEMRQHADAITAIRQFLQARQKPFQPCGVAHRAAIVQRHVQVGAQQDDRAARLVLCQIVQRFEGAHISQACSWRPPYRSCDWRNPTHCHTSSAPAPACHRRFASASGRRSSCSDCG